jgi:hypothetical protein
MPGEVLSFGRGILRRPVESSWYLGKEQASHAKPWSNMRWIRLRNTRPISKLSMTNLIIDGVRMVEFTCQYCGHEHEGLSCAECENGAAYYRTRCLANGPVLKRQVDALSARVLESHVAPECCAPRGNALPSCPSGCRTLEVTGERIWLRLQ